MVLAAARRIAFMLLVLAAASLVSFVFFWKTDQQLKTRSALHGYHEWLQGLRSGRSFEGLWTQQKLWPVFRTALEHTGVLVGLALLVVIPACIGIACLAAWRRDGVLDTLFRTFAYAVWAVPPFLLALLITLAATSFGNHGRLGPLGAGGWPDTCIPGFDQFTGQFVVCGKPPSTWEHFVHVLQALALPALALAAGFIGVHARHLRGALLQTLDAPFIVTARSKGLTERQVVFRHAMKISLATFASGLLADVGAIFGAALAVDAVFQLGGLGTLLLSLFPRVDGYVPIDVYAVQLMLLITGLFVLASSLLADGVVGLLDPRLRRTGT
jgi:peptide/nickel transport system permease protein